MVSKAREDSERGKGVPLTEEERMMRHYEQYGTYELPERGAGLSAVSNMVNSSECPNCWLWLLGGLIVGIIVGRRRK